MANSKKQLLNRINRAEGQIRALRQHLENGSSNNCHDFINQIKAARAALKRTGELYILEHISQCDTLPTEERVKKIADAVTLLSMD